MDDLVAGIQDTMRLVETQLAWVEKNTFPIAYRLIDEYIAAQPIPGPAKTILRETVSGEVAQALSEPLSQAVRTVRETAVMIRIVCTLVGSPDTLRVAADHIESTTVEPGEELALQLTLANIPSALLSNWNDAEASQAYQYKIDGRAEAVRVAAGKAATLAEGLRSAATAIEDYLLGLGQIVLGVYSAVVGVAVAIAGAPTIVGFILGALGALGGIATAIIGVVSIATSSDQNVDAALRGLQPKIPEWPQAFR